jgi:hypothetical protein
MSSENALQQKILKKEHLHFLKNVNLLSLVNKLCVKR